MNTSLSVSSVGVFFILVLLVQSVFLEFVSFAKWKFRSRWYKANIWIALVFSVVVLAMLLGAFAFTQQRSSWRLDQIESNDMLASVVAERIQTNAAAILSILAPAKGTNAAQNLNVITNGLSAVGARFEEMTNLFSERFRRELPNPLQNKINTVIAGLPGYALVGRTNAEEYIRRVEADVALFTTATTALRFNYIHYALFFVFFLGIIRTASECVSDELFKRSTLLADSLLVALVFAIALDYCFPEKLLRGLLTAPIMSGLGIIGYVFCVIVYLVWIYQVVFVRLTKAEDLGKRFVRQFIFNPFALEVPMQAILIGAKDAGKSVIFSGATGKRYALGRSTLVPESGKCPTLRVDGTNVGIGLIDTPGEHLGTHLSAALKYRTDHLAIVINAATLNLDRLTEFQDQPLEVFTSHGFKDTPAGLEARNYWMAIDYSTRRHHNQTASTAISLESLYKVRTLSIMIFVPPGTASPDARGIEALTSIARTLGERFDIKDKTIVPGATEPIDGKSKVEPKIGVEVFQAGPDFQVNGLAVVGTIAAYCKSVL